MYNSHPGSGMYCMLFVYALLIFPVIIPDREVIDMVVRVAGEKYSISYSMYMQLTCHKRSHTVRACTTSRANSNNEHQFVVRYWIQGLTNLPMAVWLVGY